MFGARFLKSRMMRSPTNFFLFPKRYLFGRSKGKTFTREKSCLFCFVFLDIFYSHSIIASSANKKSYYEYLGVDKSATAAEIK